MIVFLQYGTIKAKDNSKVTENIQCNN